MRMRIGWRTAAARSRTLGLGVIGLLGAAATPAAAHVDMLFMQEGGRVVTGEYDFDALAGSIGARVYESEMPPGQIIDEPGWNAVSDTAQIGSPPGVAPLSGSTALSFDILLDPNLGRNLSFWDGVGPVSFGAAPDSEVLTVSKQIGPMTFLTATADGGASGVPGFDVDATDPGGYLHKHLDFLLLGDLANSDIPTDGIYLLTLTAKQAGLQNSLPFWIVFNFNLDEEFHEAAVDYVNAAFVPEPGTAMLLGIGLLGLARAGRRKA